MRAPETSFETLPSVAANLTYLAPMAETPFTYTDQPPEGMPRSNAVPDVRTVPVHSMRPVAKDIALDHQGFALVRHASGTRDFYDADELKRVYYPEAEALVAAVSGASRVMVFDHTVRRRNWEAEARAPGDRRLPVMRVHNDYTERSGPQRVRDLMGEEAERLLRGRFAFINLWRPIVGPLLDHPLAVCDAGSTQFEDFVRSEQRYQGRVGEIYVARYNPRHRWYYAPAMREDEAILIKCYDSRGDVARFVAHSAFEDPTTPADARPRESIELRTIAFYA